MPDLADLTASALARAVEGHFHLEREIGRGGMGVVYVATDLQLEREVALKTLPPHLAANAAVRGRFVREARTAAALSHPNIVAIHHAAERDGVVFFAMGYVPGESLAEHLARAGPMAAETLLPILLELTDALGYAHSRGVVHRDVKAENVLIDSRTGRAMVTDFGIARVTEARPLTATGAVLGTVHYMSPEQVMGETLDGRSDLYALGVLAFFAMTGRFPFEGPTSTAVLVAHINSAAPRLHEHRPDAPDFMDATIARLLEKRPADRFANAEALASALRGDPMPPPAPAGLVVHASGRPDDVVASPVAAAPSQPEVLSSDDAQQVWARAAELQANTGALTPPPAFSLRTAGVDPLTRGYDAALVRASAAEAGIDAKHVDRALEERHALRPVDIRDGEQMGKPVSWFAGSRTTLEFTTDIEGELSETGFEEVADEVRRVLGQVVNVSAVGRTLSVSMGAPGAGGRPGTPPRLLQLHIASRNGRTTVRGFEDLSPIAGGIFGGLMGGIGMGGGMAVMGSMFAQGIGPIALGAWLGVLGTTYGGARFVFARTSRKRERQLRATMERVVMVARPHAVTKLPR
jgi:serine/threonine protein kinase